jgi:hypothetical protein
MIALADGSVANAVPPNTTKNATNTTNNSVVATTAAQRTTRVLTAASSHPRHLHNALSHRKPCRFNTWARRTRRFHADLIRNGGRKGQRAMEWRETAKAGITRKGKGRRGGLVPTWPSGLIVS